MSSTLELDLRGVVLPACLLQCKTALGRLDSTDELEVLVNDPKVVEDLVKIIRRSQGRVARPRREGDHYRIRVGPHTRLPP
jgi:TusA-related sulfurtransferase